MSEHAMSAVGDKHSGPRRHGILSILTTLLLLVACNGEEAGTAPAGDDVAVEADDPESADTDFPEDDIRWIIPASAGGGLDVTSRQVQPYWEEELGVSLVIDNQEGGTSPSAPPPPIERSRTATRSCSTSTRSCTSPI